MYPYLSLYMSLSLSIYIYRERCMMNGEHKYIYICICVYIHHEDCLCIYIYVYTYTSAHTYIYIHSYIYIHNVYINVNVVVSESCVFTFLPCGNDPPHTLSACADISCRDAHVMDSRDTHCILLYIHTSFSLSIYICVYGYIYMLCTDLFLRMHESNIVQYGSPYTANCAAYDFPPSVPVPK